MQILIDRKASTPNHYELELTIIELNLPAFKDAG